MPERQHPHVPVLKVTRYDSVSSFLIAIVLALCVSVFGLAAVWATIRPSRVQVAVPVEILEIPGGVEDGVIGETLRLDSPEEVTPDPSLADVPSPDSEIQETLDNVMDLADEATNQAEKQFELETRHAGTKGSAKGTGRRGLGSGTGAAGIPREQRWFISYSDRETLEEYAKELDFFGVELGALMPDGKIVYLSQMSTKPQTHSASHGKDETRLYMIWQGGNRRKADIQLFQKAGIQVGDAVIFQFYPAATEQKLAQIERDYKNRPLDEIRRTYFGVSKRDDAYVFHVTRQAYFK